MKLTDLEPKFVRYNTHDGIEYTNFEGITFNNAQGIWFLCPICFMKNNGPVGTHSIDVTFKDRGALDNQGSHGTNGQPTRWTVTGSSFDDLTTQPSILLGGGCGWHGYITNGQVT